MKNTFPKVSIDCMNAVVTVSVRSVVVGGDHSSDDTDHDVADSTAEVDDTSVIQKSRTRSSKDIGVTRK